MRNLTMVKILVLTSALAIVGCKSGTDAGAAAGSGAAAAEGTAAAAEGTAAAAEGTAAAAEGTAAAAEGTAAAAEGTAMAAEGTAAAVAAAGSGAAAVAAANAPSTFPGPVSAEMLHGTWNVDFMRSLQSAEMSEEERAMAMALMGSMQMAITFDAAGAMTMNATMMGENRTEAGSYRVVTVGTNTLTVETTTPGAEGEEPKVEQGLITFDSPTAARIQPGDEQPLFITRAN
jgi:hypothetical protein